TAAGASPVVSVENERNASRAPGDQAEVAIAADPSDPNILLGASGGFARTRTYTSTDGGKTWRSAADVPNTLLGDVPAGDPMPAIDSAGHQYLGFVAASPTTPAPYYALATRDGSNDDWQPTNRPILDDRFQDKPMLAVDNAPDSPYAGRLYMGGVEFRIGRGSGTMVLTHSDDRGQSWSKPVTLTTGRDAPIPQSLTPPVRRLGFGERRNGRTNVFVLRLSPELRPIGRPVAVARASRTADRFFPAIDLDESTGDLWDCFYATDGSRDLRRVRFSCSVSRDGGASWSAPARAASRFSLVTRQTGDVSFGYGDYE